MGSSTVGSLLETSFFDIVLVVSPDTITTVSDWSALAAQGRQIEERGGYTGGILVTAPVPRAGKERTLRSILLL